MAIFTNILRGGSNNHETTAENANAIATDFIAEGIVGAVANTSGVAPATGGFAVNAQGTPDMTVAVGSGVAYVTATPSGQASQSLRVYNNASANVTIAANSTGSTRYDYIYLSVDATNANNPNLAGDNVSTLVVSRSTSASSDDGTPPTYGYLLARVAVSNGATSITNGNITDMRSETAPTAVKITNPYKFRVTKSANQTGIVDATSTKVTWDTEAFDTNGNFDSSTYTVPVTGYYQINYRVVITSSANNIVSYQANLHKNGVRELFAIGYPRIGFGETQSATVILSELILLTAGDTIDVYVLVDVASGTATVEGTATAGSSFSGHLVSVD